MSRGLVPTVIVAFSSLLSFGFGNDYSKGIILSTGTSGSGRRPTS